MHLLSLIKNISFPTPPTIQDDINLSAKMAAEDISHSEATIIRAAYIRHMAQAKLAAHSTWAQDVLPRLQHDLKGTKYDRR